MITCTIGPEQGKDYLSKKGYPCKADVGIDSVKAEVSIILVSLVQPARWIRPHAIVGFIDGKRISSEREI